MAGEVDDIVQNVVLTGNEEVAAGFEKIQQAGEKAFDTLRKASENVFSFKGLVEAAGGLTAAFAIAGVGVFAFVKSTEESVSQLSDLAQQIGVTTEEISGLRAAFAAGGVSAETMEVSFRRLSLITQQTWTEIKKQAADGKDQLAQDAIAVSTAQITAAEAARTLANAQRDANNTQRSDLNSVQEARLRLAELNGQDVSFEREQLSRRQALLALDQARAKTADDAANAAGIAQKAQDAADKTQLDLAAAKKKALEDQKNDIGNVINAVKALANGDTEALKGINASTENLIKGIVGAAAEGDKALGKMRGDITDLASPAPGVKSVFDTLGKVLANLSDPAEKSSIAIRTLGRNVSQAEINVISSAQKMAEFRQRIDELKLGVDDADKAVSEKFRETLFGLQNDISLVAVKIATAFGPSATAILKTLDDALISNRQAIIEFAATLGGQVLSVVQTFIRVLSGVPDAANDQWLVDYIDKIKSFGSAVGVLVNLIATVAGALISLAGGVADTINSVFGTSINAVDLLFTAWFLKTSVGFIAMRAAAESAATGVTVAFATVAARFAIVTLAAVTLYEIIKGFHDLTIGDNLASSVKGLEDRLHAIREFLGGDFAKGIEDFKKANADQIATEAESANKRKGVSDDLKKKQDDLNKSMVDDNKSALEKINADFAQSVDDRIQNLGKLVTASTSAATSTTSATQTIQGNIADTHKAIQSTLNATTTPEGGTTDANGIRNFGSGGGAGVNDVTGFAAGAEAFAKKNNVPLSDVVANVGPNGGFIYDLLSRGGAGTHQAGLANPIFGFQGGTAQVINQQVASTDNSGRDTNRASQDIDDIASGVTKGFEDFHRAQQDVSPLDTVKAGAGTTAAPDLISDPAKEFNDKIQTFLQKALTDPGSLTPPDRPERTPTPPVDPNTLPDVGQSPLSTALDSLSSKIGELISSLATTLNKQDTTVTNPATLGVRGDATDSTAVDGLDEAGTSAGNASGELDSLTTAAGNAALALGNIGGGNNATVTAATGGHIRGPGGPTGDQIAAWLSDGEFVHSARAVSFWGTDFMHAINNLQVPRFAAGGFASLLSPSLPRFATGGLAHATAAPHLGTVDLRTNVGDVRVSVASSTLNQLRKAAVIKNIGSSTRSSWVR